MKPSKSKEDRLSDQAERGFAAQRILEDDMITAWFDGHRDSLVKRMLSAPISDDETRRNSVIEINLIDQLLAHIRHEASIGKNAIEKRTAQ